MKSKGLSIGLAAAAIVLIGAGLAAWFFISSLDRRVAALIEREGSALTGTRVSVSSVSLSLREGTGQVRGLRVANPQGFSSEPALAIDRIAVAIDIGSLRRSPIVLTSLVLEKPQVRLEVSESGKSNLDELTRRVQKNSQGPATPQAQATRLRIVQMRIPDGHVTADLTRAGGQVEEVGLKTIERADVGGKAGATTDEVAKVIVTSVAKEAARAAGQAGLMKAIEKKLGEGTGKLGEKIKGLFK